MRKRIVFTAIVLAVVFGGIFGWKAVQSHFMNQYFANFQPPPASVLAATAEVQSWQPTLEAVGSLVAVNGVEVSAEVAGIVEKIGFESGQDIKKGELLVQLDDSTDRAELRGLLASLKLARSNYTRSLALLDKRLISESQLDQQHTELKLAEAQVAAKRAVITKKLIRAPFSGRLGIRKINIGQYLAPGTNIVTLQSVDPMYANFALPARSAGEASVGQAVRLTVDGVADAVFEGTVSAIDSRIDEQTRNVAVQATLPNPKRTLQPGMSANVTLLLPQQDDVIAIPATAISYSPYGDYVYVINEAQPAAGGEPVLTVKQQFVVTGARQDEYVAITKGVSAGDRVVTAGQLKLRNGARVTIEPAPDSAPAPSASR